MNFKRIFDFSFSLSVMILMAPLYLFLFISVFLTLGWPCFYSQVRPGIHAAPFKIYKFRSMRLLPKGFDLSDEERLTRFGRLLRSTSLDEIPSLWNVVKGEMSVVGPRPLLMEYIPLYSKEQARRHSIKPGITGWAQINGRNAISWEEKFKLDIWYVDNQSFILDIKIILLTIKKVISRSNISADGEATMPKFTGNNS